MAHLGNTVVNGALRVLGGEYVDTINGVTVGSSPKFTDTNTTYTFATGDSNGQIKVTPSGGSAQNISVKGLGTAAYTASTAYATSGHTHATSIATSTGTNQLTLAASTKYAITAGGTSYIFTTPPNTTYSSKSATSGGTDVSLVTTGEKYTWNNKSNLAIGTTSTTAAAGNHTHTLSIAADSGTNQLTLAANTKYKITAGGSSYIFTTPPNASTVTTARKIINDTVRMTTADTAYSDAGLRYYLASSAMTTNKPAADGGILHMPWDSTAGWAREMWIGHGGGTATRAALRSQSNTTWGSWTPMAVFNQTTPTTGQVVVTDGTDGGVKSSGFTIAKSVPSNAVFTDTNTHRPIQVNGTEILGNNTTVLNLKAGSNVSLSNSSGTVTIAATNTTYTAATAAPGNIATSGAKGSSANYARQDHTHGIALATGDSNGQVKIAGTNVSVKGLGSNAYSSTAYLPLAGGTMTGELKTSYIGAVAMGTREGASHTIPNLCGELRYSSGCAGSVSITTAYTSGSITIPTGWYNYLWVPHRSGGANGAANGDNCNYGTLYLTGMNDALGFYMVRYSSEAIAEVNKFAGAWSASVSAAANATSCTISDSRITTSSNIEPFSSNSGGYTINVTRMVVSAGKVVLYFGALSQATSFKVRIS